jgi:hypothetical protein
MSISVRKVGKFLFFLVAPLALIITFGLTGYKYIPVDVTVGKCLKDYTNPLSYTERSSPLKELAFKVENQEVLLCYGSPSVNGRSLFGKLIPYGELWRLGANEPTRLYTTKDLIIADLVVPKGRYSIYAKPGHREWEFFVSSSINHWGNDINSTVRAMEIGSFSAFREYNREFTEQLTFTTSQNEIVVYWEYSKIRIPFQAL